MAKIPFSIDYKPQIESGEYKVETKSGVSVRIICWDARGSNNREDVIGLIGSTLGSENIQRYNAQGHLIADSARKGDKDLFIVTPEPELSEFEDRLRIICENAVIEAHLFPRRTSEDFAKKHSAELLDLATEELKKTFVLLHKDDYQTAFDLGKAEALKDLPRWEKYPNSAGSKPLINGILQKDGSYKWRLYLDGYIIVISDLEKLPGFKEDEK